MLKISGVEETSQLAAGSPLRRYYFLLHVMCALVYSHTPIYSYGISLENGREVVLEAQPCWLNVWNFRMSELFVLVHPPFRAIIQ